MAKRTQTHTNLLIAIGLLLVLVFFSAVIKRPQMLRIGDTSFEYEMAQTESAREQGLSGRTSLGQNRAMLFLFSKAVQNNCFWMKDMQFPLDIIWLNSQKQVVYTKENASPNSYPETFCPPQDSQYVIEVNAGTIHATNLKEGDAVQF